MQHPFNSFQPQARPQRPQQQQQNNGYPSHHQYQHNGYQNQGMMNSQMMMNNPMMGHMNNQIPMFYNNMHQQQQLQQFALPNHINQFLPNLMAQYAVANNNLMAQSLPLVQPNFYRPSPSAFPSQPQFNSFNPLSYPPVPNQHQNQQFRPPGFAEPRPQGLSVRNFNNANGSGTKGNGSGQGFQRSQLHQPNGSKNHKGKRNFNKKPASLNGSGVDSIAKEKKRPYVCLYTPKEVQLWREARRRNFPTKHNIEKKSKKNVSDSTLEEEAKLRRQQLREVLAKQAELGVEVAEVPSHYLVGTEEQANGNRGDNNRQALNDKPFQHKDGKGGRSQNNNRNNKRKHGEKDMFNKKPRLEDQNSSEESSITVREPTLLEKLLSADMKRDKSRLLQVFRFMVMNSFFKDQLPEQPLKLPSVMVEEAGYEHFREDEYEDVSEDEDEVDVDTNGDDNSCDKSC